MKVYIKDSRLILGKYEIPSALYLIEWDHYVDDNPTKFRLVSAGSNLCLPIFLDTYVKVTDCTNEAGVPYADYATFMAAVGSFFVKAFSTAGGDVETRLTNLENNETIYQIFHYTGTTTAGTVYLPTGATFFDPYSDGLPNQIVVKADANSNPLEEKVLTSGGSTVLLSSFNYTTGAYILSGTPSVAACLVYFIKTTEKFISFVDTSKIVEVVYTASSGGGVTQVNSDWTASSGVAQILNKPSIPSVIDDLTDVEVALDKPSILDTDFVLVKETSTSIWKKLSWSNVKSTLKSYFDTIYLTIQFAIDDNKYGFKDQIESTLAFDGINTISLSPSATSFQYFRGGTKNVISTPSSTIMTLADGERYFIFTDDNIATLSYSPTPWTLEFSDTKVPVAGLSWNSTLTPKYVLIEERHNWQFDRNVHEYQHKTIGTRVETIGSIAGYTLNSDVNANKVFAIGSSIIWDEGIKLTLPAFTKPNGITTDYFVSYRNSPTTWLWKKSNMPFIYNAGNTNNWIQWDNNGVMTDATGGSGGNVRWLNSYLFVNNALNDTAWNAIIPGRAIFTSLNAAISEDPATFDLSGLPFLEGVTVYQFTWSTASSTSQGKCVLASIPKRTQVSLVGSVSAAQGLLEVAHDATLSGLGTVASPLSVVSSGGGIQVTGTALLDFGSENDYSVLTVLDSTITSAIKAVSFLPIETVETSLDDFSLNGVTFNIENIVPGVSFDIRGTALNSASGIYTINYNLTL